MNTIEIINRLSTFVEGELPTDALLAAQENWPQVLPEIHKSMEKFVADPNSIDDEDSYFVFMGIWLLAEQKETQSLPLLIKVCDQDDDYDSRLEYLLGDSLTEGLPSFFYILANKNHDKLASLINSNNAGPYVKCAAIKAIFAQYEANEIAENQLKSLISLWIDNACKIDTMESSHVLSALASLCIENQLNEFQQAFLALAQQNKLDIEFVSKKEIEEWQSYGYSESIKSGFIKTNINVIEELSSWACYQHKPSRSNETNDSTIFDALDENYDEDEDYDEGDDYFYSEPETYIREEAKVGRNDPCPCGSGKKYKKCCS